MRGARPGSWRDLHRHYKFVAGDFRRLYPEACYALGSGLFFVTYFEIVIFCFMFVRIC